MGIIISKNTFENQSPTVLINITRELIIVLGLNQPTNTQQVEEIIDYHNITRAILQENCPGLHNNS
jgi:hypothetical protein